MDQLIEESKSIVEEIKSNEYQHGMCWQAFLDADDSRNAAFEEELDRLECRLQYLERELRQIQLELAFQALTI